MQLLPDLISWTPEGRPSIFDYEVTETELRLTTALANIGEGAVELRGGATNGNVQEVDQRIYDSDGTYTDVQAGEFVFHDEHGHIHFEGFSEFRLRSVEDDGTPGDIIKTSDKVSFCLIDVANYSSSESANYLSCGQVQGISAGWADVYSKGLPGQSIDITGLPDGEYWLEVVVDPYNQLIESDETNNSSFNLVTVDRGLAPPEGADAFESNNSFSAANALAPPQDFLYENLTIHAAGDDDYYSIIASGDGEITFSINFANQDGDLDMAVYDANQNLIARAQSISDNESVTLQAVAGQQLFVHVYGYRDATNAEYSLFVDQAGDPTPPPLNHVHGTSANDYLIGTSANDMIDGREGLDVIVGSAGDDSIFGGTGYNQVDYAGSASDYTFVRNADSTVTVTKLNGTDILTDIGGIWFQGEDIWYSMDQLAPNAPGGGTNTITGTSGGDYLIGTAANDTINMGAGVDVAVGSAGNDTINGGGAEYDQVDYAGRTEDYLFAQNTDGTISATDIAAGSVDLLSDIDGIWFQGSEEWFVIEDLV